MKEITLYQDNIPKEAGQYLWRGAFTGDTQIITVREYPSVVDGFYLGVGELRGRGVGSLMGFFSDKLTFIPSVPKEVALY